MEKISTIKYCYNNVYVPNGNELKTVKINKRNEYTEMKKMNIA